MLTKQELGQRIRSARIEAGLTQDQLAAAINRRRKSATTKYTISHMEKGRQDVYFYQVVQIAEATAKPLEYFAGATTPADRNPAPLSAAPSSVQPGWTRW